MSFHAQFACLWCGRPHQTRGADDIEGFSQLCSDCVGRAQDNDFLRFRLRQGLRARAMATQAGSETQPAASADGDEAADAEMRAYYAARAPEYDDWYLRRGRYSRGPLVDMAWQADLDAATMWLDRLPLSGEIVELAGGTGWWSPLLAQKGELSVYDVNEEPLDRARDRLAAHRLRAHIHVRDAWAEPDRKVDSLFTGFWLSHVRRERLAAFLALALRWLKPDGLYAFIDSRPDPESGARDGVPPADDAAVRRLADGREFRIPKVFYTAGELEAALRSAGFRDAEVTTTSRFFLLGRARAPDSTSR
ncbi:MAG TPA: class I SAM-dependent methyltransferase [Candidatus Caenarcaniphilales bacterium]|nr:class I SAM-dependent methyltransferase [Candidatus Caenarcaniphilales bacterium]